MSFGPPQAALAARRDSAESIIFGRHVIDANAHICFQVDLDGDGGSDASEGESGAGPGDIELGLEERKELLLMMLDRGVLNHEEAVTLMRQLRVGAHPSVGHAFDRFQQDQVPSLSLPRRLHVLHGACVGEGASMGFATGVVRGCRKV